MTVARVSPSPIPIGQRQRLDKTMRHATAGPHHARGTTERSRSGRSPSSREAATTPKVDGREPALPMVSIVAKVCSISAWGGDAIARLKAP